MYELRNAMNCPIYFQTILLQDKQKKYYCVACQELDSDVDKDNPGTFKCSLLNCLWMYSLDSCVSLLTCSHFFSALNAQAALSQVRERQLASQSLPESNGASSSEPPLSITGQPRPEHCEGAASGLRGPLPTTQSTPVSAPPASANFLPPANPPVQTTPPSGSLGNTLQHAALSSAEEAVLHKLRWATQELQHSASVEASIQLCNLIRGCAESLRSLKELQLS